MLKRQSELRFELECGPVAFLDRGLPQALDDVRTLLAVAFSLPLVEGDEVVVTDLEYAAMRLVWDEVARRTGASIVIAELALPVADAEAMCDAIWTHVGKRTCVLFFSHISSETALVLPMAELCRRARSVGILTIVDGAHGPGQLDLSLDEIGFDCYVGNGRKWLCAPKGCAFLYARDELHESLAPPVVSWGWSWNGDLRSRTASRGRERTIQPRCSPLPQRSNTCSRSTGQVAESALAGLDNRPRRTRLRVSAASRSLPPSSRRRS